MALCFVFVDLHVHVINSAALFFALLADLLAAVDLESPKHCSDTVDTLAVDVLVTLNFLKAASSLDVLAHVHLSVTKGGAGDREVLAGRQDLHRLADVG